MLIATISNKHLERCAKIAKATAAPCVIALVLTATACTSTSHMGAGPPDLANAPAVVPPPPPQASPPPVEVAGKWRLSVAGASACNVTLGGSTGASDGSVAPAGGCPGNFFTSRKWSYENNKLVIRNHKGEVLVELSFAGGHFEGQAANGGAVTLAR